MDEIKEAYKRRTYFIEKGFQTRFILKFCLLVIIGGLLIVCSLYFFASRSTTVSIVDSRVVVRTTADFLLPILVQTVLVVTIIVGVASIFVALFVSHSIFGPLYRFKNVIRVLGDGDFSTGFHIRRNDQMQVLAEEFNEMITKIRANLNLVKNNSYSLQAKLDNLSEQDLPQQERSVLRELKKISEELQGTLKFFKS
jgi:methyl-accepting chemotaxis protein